jgi:hypothetical protein
MRSPLAAAVGAGRMTDEGDPCLMGLDIQDRWLLQGRLPNLAVHFHEGASSVETDRSEARACDRERRRGRIRDAFSD